MIVNINKARIWMLSCLVLFGITLHAQDGGVTSSLSRRLAGVDLVVNATIDLPYSSDNEASVKIKNIITLSLNEEDPHFLPEDFTATMLVQINYGVSSTSTESIQQNFTVSYHKQGGATYGPKNYLSFSDAKYVKLTVLSISAPTLSNGVDTRTLLSLQDEMRFKRFYELNAGSLTPVITADAQPSDWSTVPDSLHVSWTWPPHPGNNLSQLEWTWLPDDMAFNYRKPDNSIDFNLLFKHNATRVDLPVDMNGYDIPLLYDGKGQLYYRVRAANTKASGTTNVGPWSEVSSFYFPGHNDSLNWQAATSFAEEGKRKTVIQYYDGSLRLRQTVSKDNTTHTDIIGETFYDGQGRQAIQVLPAPGIKSIISYTRNLNYFNSQPIIGPLNAYDNPALSFDLEALDAPGSKVPSMSNDNGAALYYSPNNPEIGLDSNKYIPDAEGYPYSVTRYTPDATGRIMSESGVGKALGMGSGHETKYYYGNAAQEELDGLFGTDAGNYTHYFKNMVKDANGQMSISYLDMTGHTIATALAGDPITGIKALVPDEMQYPGQSGNSITRNLLDKNTNIANGSSIQSLTSILAPATTAYQFRYQLTPDALSLPQCGSSQQVCYDCLYNLEISITDESGDQAPIVRRFNNISLTADTVCSTAAPLLKDEVYQGRISSISDNVIQFSETLAPGSYSVRKTLTLSDSSLQAYKDRYLKIGLCDTLQHLIDSVYEIMKDSSGCDLPQPVCASCISGTHKLDAIRKLMLSDMMPGTGQYARDPLDPGTLPALYSKYDIFSTANSGQPFYKNPWNSAKTLDYYYDAFGSADQSIHPDGTRQLLSNTSPATFDSLFSPSWATSLLPHHPEYDRLVFAEQNLKPSYNWIDNFNKAGTYADAAGFMDANGNAQNKDSFFLVNPGAQSAMAQMVADTFYYRMSLWQLAYGNAACNSIVDSATRTACYISAPKHPPFTGLTTSQLDQAWNTFKGLYSAVRDSMVNAYINANKPLSDADGLSQQGYILRFPTSTSQMVNQYGWTGFPTTPGAPPAVSMEDSVAAIRTSRCGSYILRWRQALVQCPAIAASPDSAQILSDILSGMKTVCEKGLDEANPYGASSVAPTTPNDNTDRSFEDVVNRVFAAHSIPKGQYCNPFVIDFPKPYGKGPQFTKEVMTVVDTCACNQFALIRKDAKNAGYDSASLVSLNRYLDSAYRDTLTTVTFEALRHCDALGKPNCIDIHIVKKYPCGGGALRAASMNSMVTPNSTSPGDSCVLDYWQQVCDTTWYYALGSPQPKPAFLECGFTGNAHCVSCAQLSALTDSYKAYFNGQACAVAPVLSTGNMSTDQIGYNIAFQQYINYKTGLQYTWTDYVKAASTAGCDLSHYLTNGSATQNVICGDSHPLDDTTGMFVKESPCQRTYNMAVDLAQALYEQRKQQLLANFEAQYRARCMSAKDNERFSVQYTPKEYHYTLYYYDLAGNLLRTISPKGARPIFRSSFIDSVENFRPIGTVLRPPHLQPTDYRYNSLNGVIAKHAPDDSTSTYWYDKLGRLAVSQNAQQAHDDKYSYTVYDFLGRITEVGQKPQETAMSQTISQDSLSLDSWINTGNPKEQITATVYDLPAGFGLNPMLIQQNLRNRVSYTYTRNVATDVNWYTASFYTYDVHGNLDTLVQDYLGVSAMSGAPDRYKRICYDYDLISGKVNGVDYQPGNADAFYHRYFYDAENRVTEVKTSRDSIVWERDAAYSYAKYGALYRTELGQQRVQGLDYTYTLQGWLKGVNAGSWAYTIANSGGDSSGVSCPTGSAVEDAVITSRPSANAPTVYTARNTVTFTELFESKYDDVFETSIDNNLAECTIDTIPGSGPGGGGGPGLPGIGESYPVARDAYNFTLHYYAGDYRPINGANTGSGVLEALSSRAAPLYNGNVAAIAVNVPSLGDPMVYNYHYDQLNRLAAMDAYGGLNASSNTFTPIQLDDYKERISFDPNGNILSYLRHGSPGKGKPVAMDSLTYDYYAGTNRLKHIGDNPAYTNNYTEDIDDQSDPSNYSYDLIGNLKSNTADTITNIDWTMYGKIASITKNGNTIYYTYDATGNRITKTAGGITTVYVRNAQGNLMSIYQRSGSSAVQQTEVDLSGSSRLGLVRSLTVTPQSVPLTGGFGAATLSTFTRGEKQYELTNHLGNVLATVTDKKILSSSDGANVEYYSADVASAQDYYPFGMIMPGRNIASSAYRYGFNGKENDNEVKGTGNQIDYGMRVYDPRAARFLSVDPLSEKYPELTPYQYASNSPVDGIDEDGLEWAPVKDSKGNIERYDWVGYQFGKPREGSVSEASSQDGEYYYNYSTDQKTKTGLLTIVPKTHQATNRGYYTDQSTAHDYTLWFKQVGVASGWDYTQVTGDLWNGEKYVMKGQLVTESWPTWSKPIRTNRLFAKFTGMAGFWAPPEAIESDGLGPVDYLIGLEELKLGKGIRTLLNGGLKFSEYKIARGGGALVGEIEFIVPHKYYGTHFPIRVEYDHRWITQAMQRKHNLPNWLVNNWLNVKKTNTLLHAERDFFRHRFLPGEIKLRLKSGDLSYKMFGK